MTYHVLSHREPRAPFKIRLQSFVNTVRCFRWNYLWCVLTHGAHRMKGAMKVEEVELETRVIVWAECERCHCLKYLAVSLPMREMVRAPASLTPDLLKNMLMTLGKSA